MKNIQLIKRVVSIVVMLLLVTVVAQAQATLRTGYFLKGNTYRYRLNPAFAGERNYIAWPVLGNLNIAATGNIGLANFVYDAPNGRDLVTFMHPSVSADDFFGGLDKNNKMFADIDARGFFVETLVLNAADQGLGQKIFENPLTDLMKVINTNVVWNFCLSEHAAKRMKEQGGGNIVFVNSNTAYRAIPDRIAYEASKGGQLGMMRGLALDLGKYNIRVNAVLPGMIKTDRWEKNPEFYANVPSRFTPIGDVAVGEDVADAVYYFAAHARNTTGAELVVDGGNTIQLYPILPKT
jgi:NAD(P)-dependent dehydrogenase (short-subunit alcohol dehydrogenase family)